MNEARRIGRHSLYSLIGGMLLTVISFAVTVFVTRKLGPENYGIFSYVLTVFIFAAPFAILGLNSILAKNVSFYYGKKDFGLIKGTFLTVVKIVLLMSVSIVAAILLLSYNLPYSNYVRMMSPYLLLSSFFLVLSVTVSGLRRIGIANLLNLLEKTTLLLALLFLVSQGIEGVITAWQLSLVPPILVAFSYVYRDVLKGVKSKIIKLKSLFSFSVPFFIGNSLGELTLYLNTFVLTYFAFSYGMAETGYYSLALNITMFAVSMLMFISSAVTPAIIQFYGEGNLKKVCKTFNLSMKYTFLFVFPAIFTLMTLADVIILEIFGKPYAQAVPVLQILSIGIVFSVLIRMLLPFIYVKNKTMEYMWLALFMIVLLIPSTFLLAPTYGATGAAIARIISLLPLYVYFFTFLSKIKVFFHSSIVFKELLCSSIFLMLFFIPKNIISASIFWSIALGMYLLMLSKLDVLNASDLRRIITLR